MAWIIVSNRLPFCRDIKTGSIVKSSGGLVSAISGVSNNQKKIWVGISPNNISPDNWKELSTGSDTIYEPVYVSEDDYHKYYNQISNSVLWPVFHYESSMTNFSWENWESYKKINKLIAESILKIANENDLIWVHDFHLFLVPGFIKNKQKNLKVGFFLHIPFPSSEVFRQLPSRNEILEGMLNSDLLGFHDYSYLGHFCNSLQSVLGIDSNLLNVYYNNRLVNLGVFPVSIDTKKFIELSGSDLVYSYLDDYEKKKNYKYLLLGVDRLDYIKGFLIKLEAFKALLKKYPEIVGEVSLLQLAIPTRENVIEYKKLKSDVEKHVGEINGEFGKPNYVPVQYIYSSVTIEELIALYKLSDALIITSVRDGMNLVALEYVACQDNNNPGIVILSEFTGASSILSESMLINPWDTENTAKTIYNALNMPKSDKINKNDSMVKYLNKYTASHWAKSFMDKLENSFEKYYQTKKIQIYSDKEIDEKIATELDRESILIFSDYDGTLVNICDTPERAVITPEIFDKLNKILDNKKIKIVIISGRNLDFLKNQFNGLNLSIASEHGAKFFDIENDQEISLVLGDKELWYPLAEKIMNDYSFRVPGSFIEKKEFSLAWHYRLSPREFASYQAKKLKEELEIGLSNLPVTVISGKKVVEAKSTEANKNYFIRWYLDKYKENNPLIIGLGDDETDEDMFEAINNIHGLTIKISQANNCFSKAKYIISSPADLLNFLLKISRHENKVVTFQ